MAGFDRNRLKAGEVQEWNAWWSGVARDQRAYLLKVDLSGVTLTGINFSNVDLCMADLSNADLREADLSGADLREANLSGADLSGANLSGAKLSRTQVLGTNLGSVLFTGACLQDWNTNRLTNLEDAKASYVYLRCEKKEFSDRRPRSGSFKPGEFAALFQQALDTLDLIFVDGIDWQAFFASFRDLRQQYNDADLTIQAIEKKSGGSFVVRLEVPDDVDKAAIEQSAKANYDNQLQLVEVRYQAQLQAKDVEIGSYQREMESYRQHNADLRRQNVDLSAIAQTLAQLPPSRITNVTNNNQAAKIGNFANVVKDNASQNTYGPEQHQFLAELAQEIQALLEQLSETYPTDTLVQKAQLVEVAIAQVQANPSLKQRILGVLERGEMEAIVPLLKHPAAAFFVEGVQECHEKKS